jgi:subtilisin family serine protease
VRQKLLVAALAATSFALVTAPAQATRHFTGRLLVTLDPRPGAHAAATALMARAHTRIAGPVVPRLHLVTVRPIAGESVAGAAKRLRATPGVSSVQAERRYSIRYAPSDPALTVGDPAAPAVPLEWWAAREGFPQAWDITHGHGASVAIIDTGIDASHPDLAPNIDETTDNDADANTGPATVDEIGHGTHVASIACAKSNNGIGLAGAGLYCRLLIFKSDFSDASVAQSIIQATDQGADSINMSFGNDGSTPVARVVEHAIVYAYHRNVIVVAAAADQPIEEQGDPANVLQPSGTGSQIGQGRGLSVTAATYGDHRASFAGYGSQVSLAAYGAYGSGDPPGLFGAFPQNTVELERDDADGSACNCRTTLGGDNRYAYLQGTSMASPMVAAVAAMVRHLNPDLDAAFIIRLLKRTAKRPAGTRWNPDLGWGILDAGHAVDVAHKADQRKPVSRVKAAATSVAGDTVTLNFTSSDKAPKDCVPSGVRSVELWRSLNGRKARRILSTRHSQLDVRVTRGSRYSYFTRAVDRSGNREDAPTHADTTVRAS